MVFLIHDKEYWRQIGALGDFTVDQDILPPYIPQTYEDWGMEESDTEE
jgi:hypothetical protein